MSDVVMSRPTTHVLPLSLAGTMTANGSCLQ